MSVDQTHKGFCVICSKPIDHTIDSEIINHELFCANCADDLREAIERDKDDTRGS